MSYFIKDSHYVLSSPITDFSNEKNDMGSTEHVPNYKVRPKKNLGQHFLTDLSIAQRIADTVDIAPQLPILEVGPGMGVMTQFLIQKKRPFKVVEIDRESVAYLSERWPNFISEIISDDFLRMDLSKVFGGQPFLLTGNYPYDISSQIFFKMLDNKDLIPYCTGMIQKEMAERIAAKPNNKSYGILSVLLQLWYDVDYLFTVEPGVFNPPPKVRSAVISMRRNDVSDCGCDELLLRRIVKGVFGMRRKMLRVSLRSVLSMLDQKYGTKDHSTFLQNPQLTKRPEQLSVKEFVELTNAIENHYKE